MVEQTNRTEDDQVDEIVEDIRAIRRAHAAAFGFDLGRIVADLRKQDASSGEPLVSLPPKSARPRVAAER